MPNTTDCLLGLGHLGIAGLLFILVEDGALMIVASTSVPDFSSRRLSARSLLTDSNSVA